MPHVSLDLPDDVFNALTVYCDRQGIKSKRAGAALLLTQALANELEDESLTYSIPEHGGWRGNEASIEALMRYADNVTDGGRNDPLEADG